MSSEGYSDEDSEEEAIQIGAIRVAGYNDDDDGTDAASML
jgi:hypothetical protein